MPYIIEWFLYHTILPTWWIYVYVMSLFGSGICGSLFNYHGQLMCHKFGLRIRAAIITLVYRKSLYAILGRNQTSGSITNLMSQDAQLIVETLPQFIQGVLAPLQIAVTVGLLSRQLGPYCLISFGVALLSFPISMTLTRRFARLRVQVQRKSDVRLKFVKEFLSAIRIVKYYAWEKPFVQNIGETRLAQLAAVKKVLRGRATLASILPNIPQLGAGLTFMAYGLNNSVNFTAIFSAIAYLNMMRVSFIYLPMLLAFVGQYSASFERITFFALRAEIRQRAPDADPEGCGGMRIENGFFAWETPLSIAESRYLDVEKEILVKTRIAEAMDDESKKTALQSKILELSEEKTYMSKVVRNLQLQQQRDLQLEKEGVTIITAASFEEIAEEERTKYPKLREPIITLKDISLDVPQGKLTTVVGAVGSGKSTLGMAFLGEVTCTDGTVWLSSDVSYAPQEAWILNATIRDNITFGQAYDPTWYAEVIRACSLATDLAMFHASDLTEIGERGINLSGGQRQRINVARAMYSKSKIVILDDPFSAVDAHVGEHMFANVAKKMARDGRCVLLITNQLHFVPEADYCAVLKKGKLVEYGAPAALLENKGGYLKKMMANQTTSTGVSVTEAERLEADKTRNKVKAAKDVIFEPSPEKDEEYRRKGALIKAEEREFGNISLSTYWRYMRAGGIPILLLVTLAQAGRTTSRVMGGIWLSWWSSKTHGYSNGLYDGVYVLWGIGEGLFTVAATFMFVQFALSAGRQLHIGMTAAVARAPVGWFDVTPVGRIIARFSKDIDFIDVQLPQLIEQSFNFFFLLAGVISSIAVGTPYVLIIFAVMAVFYVAFTWHYRKTSIQVQRLEATSRAPIFSHFAESVDGAVTIRAYRMARVFNVSNNNKVDDNTLDYLGLRLCSAWFGITLDMMGNSFVMMSLIAMILVRTYAPNSIPVGYIIFAAANAGSISVSLSNFSNATTDLENRMNSAERVLAYFDLPSEAPDHIPDNEPPTNWPAQGEITIKDLVIEYKKGMPVLRDLSCHIRPREKVGIVGRTGAGKSTLITALFRTMEPTAGSIHIDGVDITQIGLFDLRSRLSIIPQMPQLFVGTVRYNLDPFDNHSDDDLWRVLKMVKLKEAVAALPGKLDAPVEENGSNFSVGQRQLLSMSRCLLRDTHVLLLDEATAAVDVETDALLQSMIRKNFKNKTVLVVAHRLNTIMDSDRIMVLDAGKIVEFDTPANLLNKKDGVLHGMVEATGAENAAFLMSIVFGQVSVADSLLNKSTEVLKSSLELRKSVDSGLKSSFTTSNAEAKPADTSPPPSSNNDPIEFPPRKKNSSSCSEGDASPSKSSGSSSKRPTKDDSTSNSSSSSE